MDVKEIGCFSILGKTPDRKECTPEQMEMRLAATALGEGNVTDRKHNSGQTIIIQHKAEF